MTAVAVFVREFGLDGADIDYEADAGLWWWAVGVQWVAVGGSGQGVKGGATTSITRRTQVSGVCSGWLWSEAWHLAAA